MSNTILIKRSGTANTAPDAGNLALGELAINYNDGNLFYKNASNQITVIASNKFLSVSGNVQAGGLVSAVGNITGGNILTGGLISATSTITSGANITGGNLLTSGLVSAAGNLIANNISTSGAGGNITGANVITGTTISAIGNAVAGNVVTTGLISAGSNITGGNLLTSGVISAAGNVTVNASSFFIGNGSQLTGVVATGIGTLASLSVTGNIDTGNLRTAGVVTATGNVTGGNILTAGVVSAGGNIITANLNASNLSSSGTVTIATGSGDLNLQPAANIALGNRYVTGVAYPVQDQDAASKLYVDNLVTTAISYHQAVVAATNTSLATATGGTITYNQPNGAGNGVGATLTTTGSYTLIDTANVQTVGTRILVKDEANAAHNGIYTYSNSTVIVRATNEDTYGAGSVTSLSINDYFFVQSGNINKGSAYIVDEPTGVITFGTSNIGFAQFSNTQVYTANTNAGLVLVGTEFSAKVDLNTTAFDGGGNIVVKANANLTTPNIGAATGTSLSVTGNVSAGNVSTGGNVVGANIYSGGLLSAAGNIQGNTISLANDVLAIGLISAQGNVTGNYFIGNGSQLTGIDTTQIQNGTSNVQIVSSGGNVTVGVGGVANIAKFTTAGLEVIGLISATGNLQVDGVKIVHGIDGQTNGSFDVHGQTYSLAGPADNSTTAVQTLNIGRKFNTNTATQRGAKNINVGFSGTAISEAATTLTLFSDTVLANSNATAINTTSGALQVIGGVGVGGNIYVGELISAAGNVTAGNVDTSGLVSAGNLSATNLLLTGAYISTTGGTTITLANLVSATGGVDTTSVSASGNVTGGNILTNGLISAQGNVTGNYFIGNGSQLTGVTATSAGFPVSNGTSNINASSGGPITVGVGGTSNIAVFSTTGVEITGLMSSSGNITGGNILTGGIISAGGTITAANISGSNLFTGGMVSALGNITTPNVISAGGNVVGSNFLTTGIISAQGNVTGDYFIGNGSQLTGIDATSIQNGTSNVRVITTNGNVTVGIGGTSNIAVFSSQGLTVTGLIGPGFPGNIVAGNLVTESGGGVIGGYVSATGNVIGGNILTAGLISATANVTGGNIDTTGTANVATLIVTSLANITATTAAANTTSGALLVAGGVGVAGNVYAGGMYVGSNSVLTTTSTVDGGTF